MGGTQALGPPGGPGALCKAGPQGDAEGATEQRREGVPLTGAAGNGPLRPSSINSLSGAVPPNTLRGFWPRRLCNKARLQPGSPPCLLQAHPASSRPPVGGVQAQGLILTNPAHPHPPEGVSRGWAPFVPVLAAPTTSWHPVWVVSRLPLSAPAAGLSFRTGTCRMESAGREVGHQLQTPPGPQLRVLLSASHPRGAGWGPRRKLWG